MTKHLRGTLTADNIDTEWDNIKQYIIRTTIEVLGKTRLNNTKKSLQIWNKEIREMLREKWKAYLNFIQRDTEE